jgi:carbonic anhydrase
MKIRFLIAALLLLPLALHAADNPTQAISREEALSRLADGNARYMSAAPAAWCAGAEKRTSLAQTQHPIACVVTCSDSRVVPEILFDQSLGSLFVVRNAGNLASADVLASVEYAVTHLKVPVVIVLGHTDCEAAAAAFNGGSKNGTTANAANVASSDAASLAKYAKTNARLTAMSLLDGSTAISQAVASHQTALISGLYDVASGKANMETELASVAMPTPKVAASVPATAEKKDVSAPASAPAKSETAAVKPVTAPVKAEVAAAKPAAKDSTGNALRKQILESASFARRSR